MHDILLRIQYGKDDDQVGISRLISNRSFSKAFPIHDVCIIYVIPNSVCVHACVRVKANGTTHTMCPGSSYFSVNQLM